LNLSDTLTRAEARALLQEREEWACDRAYELGCKPTYLSPPCGCEWDASGEAGYWTSCGIHREAEMIVRKR
jgi:hypothetical protein